MQNALDPSRMTSAERLTELGEILAAGLLRLRAREQETATGRGTRTIDVPYPRKLLWRKRGSA